MINLRRWFVFSITGVCLAACFTRVVVALGTACNSEPSVVNDRGNTAHVQPGTSSSPHQITFFIDPTFTSAEKIEIAGAVSSWFQSGPLADNFIQAVFSTSDPGASANSSIRVMNYPAGSPNEIATTAPYRIVASGAIGSGQTINFNKGATFQSGGSTTPVYDPTLPSAAAFFQGTAAHEIGHALGLTDTGEQSCHGTSTSTMGPGCGTNNQGDGSSKPDPTSTSPTACDKATVGVNIISPWQNGIGHPVTGGGDPVGGGGGGGQSCYVYDVWDESTYTLSTYTVCL